MDDRRAGATHAHERACAKRGSLGESTDSPAFPHLIENNLSRTAHPKQFVNTLLGTLIEKERLHGA